MGCGGWGDSSNTRATLKQFEDLTPREAMGVGLAPSCQRDAARGFAFALSLAKQKELPPGVGDFGSPRLPWHRQNMERSMNQ